MNSAQIAGTLTISKFNVDVSGNNGSNAKKNIDKTPSDNSPDAINDITFSDLSANTVYDLKYTCLIVKI